MKTVGIVGHGAFGAFLGVLFKRFAPQMRVRFFSRSHKPDGNDFFPFEDVAQCDAIILGVPIHALEGTIKRVVPLMGKYSVLVDVSTVKKYPLQLLKKYAKGKRYIATHPMWGPESYEKRAGDVAGFRIVVSAHTLPEDMYVKYKKEIAKLGFNIIEKSADAHDKESAQTLFLTHFIGQTVSRAGFVRTDIDTVSFGNLMDAVESVKHDSALFADVFEYNPYCKNILDKFEAGERKARKLLEK